MLILLAMIAGAVWGVGIHFLVAHRDTRGVALAPMIGAVVGALVWLAFTWAGLSDTGWIWLASLLAPLVVTWPIVAVLARTRVAHDARRRQQLRIG